MTAFQSDKVQFTATLSIQAFGLFYESPVILSGSGSSSPKTSAGAWSDWGIDHCLPGIGFVKIQTDTGALSLDGSGSTEGAFIGEDSAAIPQPGGLCSVSAMRRTTAGTGARVLANVLVTEPTSISTISYTPSQVLLSVDENAFEAHAGSGEQPLSNESFAIRVQS